ncbi:MAG: choice-of-anchor U domain-containing protein [Euryarchaeota archaeon]|nr:choice-of-anchor U domain-containing protein [Euryarchaeota archaeon]
MTGSRILLLLIAAAVCVASAGVGAADGVDVTFEGRFGGVTYDVAVSGNYAYIGQGQDLVVLDVSSPDSPVELGRVVTSGVVRGVTISGDYAYVAEGRNGLVIVDIADKVAPMLAGSYNTEGHARGVAVSGDYVYVADCNNGLVIVDVTDKSAPSLAGSYDTAGSAWDVAVSGDYAYVADFNNGLVIVDVSSKSAPSLAGSYDTAGWSTLSVAISGDYAYVADWDNSLMILDITDKAAPTLTGSYDIGPARGVAVSGDYAYIADGSNGLVIVDVSSKSAPTLAGSYDTAGSAYGVAVSGDYAYVADYYSGLVIVDVSSKSAPSLAGSYDTAGWYTLSVAISGDYAYVADCNNGLVIVDVSSKSAPTLAGSYGTAGFYTQGVAVSGDYVYVADCNNGLVIVDVSSKSAPTLAGSYDTTEFDARGVAVSGDYAYVADGSNGLVIVDVSSKSAPTLAGSYGTAGFYTQGVAVSGDYVYVADCNNGLVIVDVTDKSAPSLAGSYDTAGWAYGVALSGDYAYVADWDNGLVIVDVTDKSAPSLAGSYDTAGSARGVAVSGDYAYIADYTNGLVILHMDASGATPLEITRSRLGINTHWYRWVEDFPAYKEKIKNFGIVRDGAWWYDLETSDLTGSEWDHANWDYPYDLKTICGREVTYQSGYDNLVRLYQDEDSPELLMVLNQDNNNISSSNAITADQYSDYVYHIVERYDGDGVNDMPGLIRPVRYFEVGNEVDYGNMTANSNHDHIPPKDYVEKRLIPAYNAAKSANKDAIVMGAGLGMGSDLYGNDGQEFNTMYFNAMYDNITKNGGNKNNNFYMDKVAIHYYAKPNAEFDENIKKVEDVIQKYESRDKPIWITEFFPLTEIGSPDSTTGAFARLLTLMFANKIEMPLIYSLKGEHDVTCVGEEETITPRESIQVIDTVVSTLHGTTPSEAENKDISVEPGKTTYQRVFNNSGKKVTVLWYIDDADSGAVTNYDCTASPESPQTFTVDVLGTANFSTDPSPIHLKIGSKPTYVVETDPPIDLDLYFNKTTTAGVATERATSFRVGDTLYGKLKTATGTSHTVKTYITMTMPDGTCRYAHYDKPDFDPGNDELLFSDTKVPLYYGVWNATTNDWLWNIYEFTGGDSGSYRWNCWYEYDETGEILGGNFTEYTFSATPSGTPVESATGKGEVYLDSSAGTIEDLVAIPPDAMPEVPDSLNPVYGFFSFTITGISSGESVNIPLAFPENVPAGTEYWKYGPTSDDNTPHWYQVPVSDNDGDRIIVITLTDGGIGDDDLTEDGVIVDDGGPSLTMSKKGDLNHDGNVTPADAAIALRIAASGAHDDAADVSGDGRVTSLDALMILQAAVGTIEI